MQHPFLQGLAGFHGGTWLGRGKVCLWDTSSLLLLHPPLPTVLYFSLVLIQEKGGTGGKHTCILWLWYCTLHPTRDVTEEPSVSFVWKMSHSPVRLLCESLWGAGEEDDWTKSPCCPAPGQKMFSGRTSVLSSPFPTSSAIDFPPINLSLS